MTVKELIGRLEYWDPDTKIVFQIEEGNGPFYEIVYIQSDLLKKKDDQYIHDPYADHRTIILSTK